MSHFAISTSKEPVRLFKSDFLEFFTHIHPAVIVVIWLPAAILFMVLSALQIEAAGTWLHLPAGFVIGLFLWTLAEYILHRFLFHYRPRNARQERIFFLFHGVHHYQPKVKTRLVMPPVLSIPLAALFYLFFWVVCSLIPGAQPWTGALFSGFLAGYLTYDLTHYSLHHVPFRGGYYKFLKRYHAQHHYRTPDARFGVSSPLWDKVFGTYPKTADTED
ncbi:MAG: sterol desaturase family protein [bacterium]